MNLSADQQNLMDLSRRVGDHQYSTKMVWLPPFSRSPLKADAFFVYLTIRVGLTNLPRANPLAFPTSRNRILVLVQSILVPAAGRKMR